MQPVLLILAMLAGHLTGSVTNSRNLPAGSLWQFPCAGGLAARARVQYASAPDARTQIRLTTTLPANRPGVLGTFSVEVTEPVHLRSSPSWVVPGAATQDHAGRYEMDLYDTYAGSKRAFVSYAGKRQGSQLVFPWFGPQLDLQPNHRYVFELVRNGTLNRLPH